MHQHVHEHVAPKPVAAPDGMHVSKPVAAPDGMRVPARTEPQLVAGTLCQFLKIIS